MRAISARPRGRVKGRVRRIFGFVSSLCAVATATPARTPEWLAPEGDAPGVLVFPPGERTAAKPITVMLHGMCGVPENECPYFARVAAKGSWLICPRGTLTCSSGGATWAFPRRVETIDAAIRRVEAAHPGEVDARDNATLIGFSLGAFVAMDLVNREPTRWARVVLIGGKVVPDPRHLLRGTTRLVFGAGEFDQSYSHMSASVRRLRAAGVTATFLGLGRVGHRFADDMDGWLERALGG
jgi:predicted esterase